MFGFTLHLYKYIIIRRCYNKRLQRPPAHPVRLRLYYIIIIIALKLQITRTYNLSVLYIIQTENIVRMIPLSVCV